MSELSPRTQTELFGHEQAERTLLQDIKSGKMAHGIILSGPRGIGKATLAYRFARMLLADAEDMEVAQSHPVFHRIAAGSHADLLVIEPLFDPKKDELKTEISAEQAREIPEALSLTAGEGKWRIIIIDSADALNNTAANAILKILEEPPPRTVLLLVSHNAGRLLPTIRSRCRTLTLQPLKREDFTRVMRLLLPEVYGEELASLGMLSNNSPGVAVELHGQGALELYNEICELTATLPAIDHLRLHRFADSIAAGKSHTNWQLFMQITLHLLQRTCKAATGLIITPVNDLEAQAITTLASLHTAHIWAEKWQQTSTQFLLAQARHLDYKQLVLAFFHSLASSEEFVIGQAA